MPASPFVFHSGIAIVLAVVFITIAASVFTFITASITLWLYQKALAKRMAASTGPLAAFPGITYPRTHKSAKRESVGDLYGLIRRQAGQLTCQHTVAGLGFAFVATNAAFYALSITQINYLQAARHPLQWLFLFWTFLWPGVLTANFIMLSSPGKKLRLVAAYFLGLISIAVAFSLLATEDRYLAELNIPAFSGESPLRLIGKWLLFNAAPTVLHIAFQLRFVRAVAPLVLAFMATVSAGLLGFVAAAYQYQDTSVTIIVTLAKSLGVEVGSAFALYFIGLIVSSFLGFGLFGWLLMAKIRNDYLAHKVSDQSLAIDFLWFLFTAFYAVILAFAGFGWACLAILAFGIYKATYYLGGVFLFPQAEKPLTPPTLLVLRVFSLGNRSENLFGLIARYWRYIGHVQLITGTDIAVTTMTPHRFLAFISGKLNRCFIKDSNTLKVSLAQMDNRTDRDGRFRINDFFCYADTWQTVLTSLVASSNVVFMDLRNFTEQNKGCVFEIAELLANVPLNKLVFAIDHTTNTTFLSKTMADNFVNLTSDSPNYGLDETKVKYIKLTSSAYPEIDHLIQTICVAAANNGD